MKTNVDLVPVTFHRVGTTESPNTNHEIDIYEIVSYRDGICDRLYIVKRPIQRLPHLL